MDKHMTQALDRYLTTDPRDTGTDDLQCHFCEAEIPTDSTGMIAIDAGEVGEFYKPSDPDVESVLAHVDCLPGGLGYGGQGGDWEIA